MKAESSSRCKQARECNTENEFVGGGAGCEGARGGGGGDGERRHAQLRRTEDGLRQAREHRVRGREQELEQLTPRVVRDWDLRLGRGGQGGRMFGEHPYRL